jgi:hypothetical protein
VGTLCFQRPTQYADWFRSYQLFVDGHPVGKIGAGSNFEIKVPAGRHEIVAKIDWCKSNFLHLEVQDGAIWHLEVGSNVTGWRLLLALLYITIMTTEYLYLREA